MANSEDPDQTPRSAASDLGLHCLLRCTCSNTLTKNGNNILTSPELTFVRQKCKYNPVFLPTTCILYMAIVHFVGMVKILV